MKTASDPLQQAIDDYLNISSEIVTYLMQVIIRNGIKPTAADRRLSKRFEEVKANLDRQMAAALTRQEIEQQDAIEVVNAILDKMQRR